MFIPQLRPDEGTPARRDPGRLPAGSAQLPAYQRIADHFRQLIQGGHLQPGDKLPGVREIAQQWGVARPTADKAMSLLQREGLATTGGRGAGTRVAARQVDTIAIAIDQPDVLSVLSAEVAYASDAVAADLGVAAGSAVIVVRLVRERGVEPPCP